ncbi:hypothetical protein M2650_04065 [Luteimonas sp. SX5]|uniref:Secreted protein n=1 Tax=Luteimonas galliterrae TaxID=2940486 RepID=A0ABT0MG27_9GAMM|nr:hypothetical protein [Luteimonas galliterrae]MCL1633819.1 hypothetical protein [Luteimonas galliterrae]
MKTAAKHSVIPLIAALAFALGLSCSPRALAADGLECKLAYNIDGWSLVYKHATGNGTVTCSDGKSLPVKIKAQAIGLTAGKWEIRDGKGRFSDVSKIDDVLGTYAQAEANAGVVKSGSAQVLTKGPVSLALAGTGGGVNLGVDVGRFELTRP